MTEKPAAAAKDTERENRYWRHIAVAAAAYVLFQFVLPPAAPITRGGMGILGIFIATIYLWMTVGTAWTSFLAIGMIGLTNVASAATVIQKSWGDTRVPFFCACLLLNYAMAETGLMRRFAIFFITRKFLRGRPWAILFMFFLSVQFIGLVSTSTPVVAMYMAIAAGIFEATGYQKGDKFTEAVILAIAWVAQGAMAMTPVSHNLVQMVLGFILNDFNVNISIWKFSMVFLTYGLVYFGGFWLVFRFIVKPDVSKLASLDIEKLRTDLPPMDKREKTVALVFGLLVFFWTSPDLLSVIPGLESFAFYVGELGQTIPAIVAVGILCAIHIDGKPVLDIHTGSSKLAWGAIYMMAALMLFGYCFNLENVGIYAWLENTIAPLTSHLSAAAFIAVVIGWILVMNNFMSNTLCAMLYTVMIPMSRLIPGVSPLAIALIIASAANADSLLTPASCPVSSMVTGSGWVRPKFMMRYSWILMIIAFLGYYFIGYPLAVLLF